jgi:hypothetical protein
MSNYSAIIFPPVREEAILNPDALCEPPPYNEIFLDDSDLPTYEAAAVSKTDVSTPSLPPTEATATEK